jgi:uncharacterized membrane protein HdeD (DUF308 family)
MYNLQRYIDLTIHALSEKASYYVLPVTMLLLSIYMPKAEGVSSKIPIVLDAIRFVCALVILSYGLLLAASQTYSQPMGNFTKWLFNMGKIPFFPDKAMYPLEKHVLMFIYISICMKGVHSIEKYRQNKKKPLHDLILFSGVASGYLYMLLYVVTFDSLLYPFVFGMNVLFFMAIVTDRLIQIVHTHYKMVPQTVFLTNQRFWKSISGTFVEVTDNTNGGHSIQIEMGNLILMQVFGILMFFVKDLFFKDISI